MSRPLLAPLLAAVLLAACSKPEPPKLEPRSIALTSLVPTKLRVELVATNPNSFPIVVQSVKGKLDLGRANHVAEGSANDKISLPAKASTTVTTDIQVNWASLRLPERSCHRRAPSRTRSTERRRSAPRTCRSTSPSGSKESSLVLS